jgi:predicted CXXCH cytochrome family protein
MKKLLFALVLGIALVLALASVAAADNGPHGGFTATTDACASCHRAHSAQVGSDSLLIMDPEALCLSCHNGTGAGTNVVSGVYAQGGANHYYGTTPAITNEGTDGASLFGGGFTNTLMATAWSGKVTADPTYNAISRSTTSMHNIGVMGTVWGSGAANSTNGAIVLECTSCHDPHGNAGFVGTTSTKTASYRLLRYQPQGSGGFTSPGTVNWSGGAFPAGGSNGTTTGWTVPDNFTTIGQEWYTIGTTSAFAVGDYNAGNANNVYNVKNPAVVATLSYIPAATNTAYFCAQCHDRYFTNSSLRKENDQSVYCGHPLNGTTVVGTATLSYQPDADGHAPWIHPGDAAHQARCLPQVDASNNILTWGDNGSTGDNTYKFMHTSGDVLRASGNGTVAAGAGTSVSRSCVACHVAHGTSAQMTAFASDATLAAVAGNDTNNSVLLRMDNRSVCLRCHASTVNFVVGP